MRRLKLLMGSRFTNRKSPRAVRHKKGLYKLKILFDRLFVWLYNEERIRFIFGTLVRKVYTPALNLSFNLIYRKTTKILLKYSVGIFSLFGPLLQFDIAERRFTCLFD
jgi:hypothetical protein